MAQYVEISFTQCRFRVRLLDLVQAMIFTVIQQLTCRGVSVLVALSRKASLALLNNQSACCLKCFFLVDTVDLTAEPCIAHLVSSFVSEMIIQACRSMMNGGRCKCRIPALS